jgi:hypothetical protein
VEPWLQITLAIAGIVVSPFVAYSAAKRGVQRGIDIASAVHSAQIKEIQSEVVNLRHAKHEIAQRVTEHEAWLAVLRRKAGIG